MKKVSPIIQCSMAKDSLRLLEFFFLSIVLSYLPMMFSSVTVGDQIRDTSNDKGV